MIVTLWVIERTSKIGLSAVEAKEPFNSRPQVFTAIFIFGGAKEKAPPFGNQRKHEASR